MPPAGLRTFAGLKARAFEGAAVDEKDAGGFSVSYGREDIAFPCQIPPRNLAEVTFTLNPARQASAHSRTVRRQEIGRLFHSNRHHFPP